MQKRFVLLVTALVVAIVMSIAFAAVFSYYPVSIAIAPTSPPVRFVTGSNANQPDLGPGNTIEVSIGSNETSASLTIHPTYQVTYYKNVTLIVNGDTKAYSIYLRVASAASLPPGATAYIYVYSKGASRSLSGYPTPAPSGYVAAVNLASTGTTFIGSLAGGSAYEIDVYVYIPEGVALPATPATAQLLLIATPSGETPP
uniref:Uncharacterized protein n=1 Tax=Ignisphaera aggregans TaxID=334771 RepID=A0A7J3Z8P7_9CREN